jgi:hypothetical protein
MTTEEVSKACLPYECFPEALTDEEYLLITV